MFRFAKTLSRTTATPLIQYVVRRSLAKEIKFGSDARVLMLQGVDILADAVAVTMGPKVSFNIFLKLTKKNDFCIFRDEMLFLNKVGVHQKLLKMVLQLLKESNLKINFKILVLNLFKMLQIIRMKKPVWRKFHPKNYLFVSCYVGDGTTAATILARAIAKEGFDKISRGANPIEVRRGIMLAVSTIVNELKRMSKNVTTPEEIAQVATISANGDVSIGDIISNAMKKVGKNGVITVKVSSIVCFFKIKLLDSR